MPFSFRRGALGAAAFLAACAPAVAHVVLERPEARPDTFYKAILQVTHGCKGSPTTSVTVTIPDGAVGARPMAKPGWTITAKRGPYRRAYPFVHGSISEGVREISWSGNTLPADQFDEFVFSVRMSDDFVPGDVVAFPVVQTCEAGGYRWVEIPAAGQDRRDLAEPAPVVRIVPAATTAEATRAAAARTVKAGALVIETPWMRATPAGATVAGGYLRITNTGTEPDRLVGTSIPLAGRGEVHEMRMDAGVMKMRPLDAGLAIKPGEAVELKPGGFHLMFMDLTAAPIAGQSIRGSVTFEKAGKVDLTFEVAPVGAPGPAGHQH